ncbi:protein FAR1-RELATED SEQUENCE 5-like [Miscanthus floridulus]|uniref:protein FAR1-RELATED SEQUENCE 5-like n=1 Tax=Miscanthus floridulus TaxID=154761 RepID=UPI0034575AB3
MSDDDSLLEYSEIVMKMFGNEDDGFEFYNNYAYEKGFSVRKEYCKWDNGHNAKTLRKFVCSCEGFRAEKEVRREIKKRRPQNITRCGCCAQLVIAQDPNTGQWYVKDFIDEHNHPMTEPDLACFLRSHRRISDDQKAEIVQLQISGIRKHQIMDIMVRRYGVYDKVGFTSRDLYNFCHRNKAETLSGGDARTIISYMTESKRRDPDFFFQYKTDGRGHLTGLLWCDFQCQMDYRAFGDVVVFDGTYKTNRYNLALVPFVGVCNHEFCPDDGRCNKYLCRNCKNNVSPCLNPVGGIDDLLAWCCNCWSHEIRRCLNGCQDWSDEEDVSDHQVHTELDLAVT